MGHEIFYCFKCQTRLRMADFEEGAAMRVGEKIACTGCAAGFLESLSETERSALLEKIRQASENKTKSLSLTTSGIIRALKAMPPPPPPPAPRFSTRAKVLAISGASIVLVSALVVLLAAGGGNGEPIRPAPRPPAVGPAAPAVDPREAGSKEALEKLRRFAKEHPDDLPRLVGEYRKFGFDWAGTSAAAQSQKELDLWLKKLDAAVAGELASLEKRIEKPLAREEFKTVVDLLRAARAGKTWTEWTGAVDRRIEQVQNEAARLYNILRDQAVQAAGARNPDVPKGIRERIGKWGIPEYAADLDGTLARIVSASPVALVAPVPPVNPAPPPKPLSPEAQNYRRLWESAMTLAGARRYAEATKELQAATASLRDAALKVEAEEDVASVRQVQAVAERSLKTLAEIPRGESFSLEYLDEKRKKTPGTGVVMAVSPDRVRLDSMTIETADLTCSTLADLYARADPGNAKPAVLFLLLEGDPDAATFRGGRALGVREKYWEYAAKAAEARRDLPELGPKEYEARKLFYSADENFSDPQSRIESIAQYKTILDRYAETPFVKRTRALVDRRSEYGKEFFLDADRLGGSGTFRMSRDEKVGSIWTSESPSDPRSRKDNFVEVEFFALPGVEYKCWIYAGACCAETWTFFLQATGLVGNDPRTKEALEIAPGTNIMKPVKHAPAGLPLRHATHKKNLPLHWEWVSIPLPKYSSAGPKLVRLLTDHPSFSVAYASVSSSRAAPPSERELANLKAQMEPDESASQGPDQDGAAAAWMVVGPLATAEKGSGFYKDYGPERTVQYRTSYGDDKGRVCRWKLTKAIGYKMDFNSIFGRSTNAVAYASTHIYAPRSMEVVFATGSDDGIRMWLNGKLVLENRAWRAVKVFDETTQVTLQRGWNRVLVKVDQGDGDWGMAFGIRGAPGKVAPTGLKMDPFGN